MSLREPAGDIISPKRKTKITPSNESPQGKFPNILQAPKGFTALPNMFRKKMEGNFTLGIRLILSNI